jgi:hypothetical protein
MESHWVKGYGYYKCGRKVRGGSAACNQRYRVMVYRGNALREIRRDINGVDEQLSMQRVEITDTQIDHMAENIRHILLKGESEEVRNILREPVASAELHVDPLVLNNIPPLYTVFVNKTLPPREFEGSKYHLGSV